MEVVSPVVRPCAVLSADVCLSLCLHLTGLGTAQLPTVGFHAYFKLLNSHVESCSS